MKREVGERQLYGGPRRLFPAVSEVVLWEIVVGRWPRSRSFRKRGQHPGTWGPRAEARRVTDFFRDCSHVEVRDERQSGERCRGLFCLSV